jgi:hypothetical protein
MLIDAWTSYSSVDKIIRGRIAEADLQAAAELFGMPTEDFRDLLGDIDRLADQVHQGSSFGALL